jgi:F1F0 ATPase subunit 2
MNEWLAGLTGALLGALFFGGLRLTVHSGLASKTPAPWFLISFVVRTASTLVGLWWVSRIDVGLLPACVLGFFLTHLAVAMWMRSSSASPRPSRHGATDAPQS